MERRQCFWEKPLGVKHCGIFLKWGIDFEELGTHNNGTYAIGHFSAAIIERPSGEISLVPATSVTFINAPTPGESV